MSSVTLEGEPLNVGGHFPQPGETAHSFMLVNKDLVIGKGAVLLASTGVDKSLEGGKTYFGAPAEEARKKSREMAYIRRLRELCEGK